MTGRKKNLASFSKEKRRNALKKYKVIEPFLKDELSLADISSIEGFIIELAEFQSMI